MEIGWESEIQDRDLQKTCQKVAAMLYKWEEHPQEGEAGEIYHQMVNNNLS
jgi:hypothetical protein